MGGMDGRRLLEELCRDAEGLQIRLRVLRAAEKMEEQRMLKAPTPDARATAEEMLKPLRMQATNVERSVFRALRAKNLEEKSQRQRQMDEERERKRAETRALKLSRSRKPEERAEFALGLLNELPPELASEVAVRGLERARARGAQA